MASFSEAYKLTDKHEGGYQNMASDKGNYTKSGKQIGTNWGISAKTLEGYLGREPSLQDMVNLPKSTAMSIYKKYYWSPYKLDELKSQDVANNLFDASVNQGQGTMLKVFGEALGISQLKSVNSDTISKANSWNGSELTNKIVEIRIKKYKNLNNSKFEIQWIKRAKNYLVAHKKESQLAIGLIALIGIGILAYHFKDNIKQIFKN